MAQVIWTEPAQTELNAIAEVISLDKPEAAARLVARIFQAAERLDKFPLLGPRISEAPRSHIRHLVIPPCRVLYRPEKDRVLIVFVMRGERQFQRSFIEPTDR